jgi:shikimate 5-dehydrogenase
VAEGLNIRPTILIAGLGGAGKAAAAAAYNLKYDLILMNRDISKAEVMAARLSDQEDGINIIEVHPLTDFTKCFRKADIIIYNIPTAIPQLAELTDEDFRGTKVVLEANYKNPSFDKNMTDRMIAANPDARYVSGETWLLYQALTGYELFTGEKPNLGQMSDVI